MEIEKKVKNKPMKPNPYGTGRDDLLIKTPDNGLIKNNVLIERIRDEIVIDSGMESILKLFWDNGIQTHGCCYGHTEDDGEAVAWIYVNRKHLRKAYDLAIEVGFDKPLGICSTYYRTVFFNKQDSKELSKWSLFPFEDFLIITTK